MKRLFMAIAFLSIVVASAVVAHSNNRDEDGLRARQAEEAKKELEATLDARKVQTLAAKDQADRADHGAGTRDKAKGKYVDLERNFPELNRLISDLHRGGQPDRAAQMQRRALEIAQQLRSGKNAAASKQLNSLIVQSEARAVERVERQKREDDERSELEAAERHNLQHANENTEQPHSLTELLADRSRELAEKVKRDIHNRVKDLERRAKDISVEERIRELYEHDRVEEAVRLAQELREHLQREHGENRRVESYEQEGEREGSHDRERERGHEHDRIREREWEADHERDSDHDEEQRVHHLRQAAEHLHAAGFHEEAERAMENAERLQQRAEHGHAEHLERNIHELSQHLGNVADRLERLESLVKKLVHRIEGEEEEYEEDDDEGGGFDEGEDTKRR